MKLSPAQNKALIVIRQNGGSIVANGIIASRNRVTFATLLALKVKGLLTSDLIQGQWQFDAVRPANPGPFSAKDQRILNAIAKWMTISIRQSEIPTLRFYVASRTRLCITIFDTLLPEVWVKDGAERLAEMSVDNTRTLAAWLVLHGAKRTAKPKPFRAAPPLYD